MKKAFLAYFTLGYPNIETTEEVIKGAIEGGATGIEIGIPFSDPVADGPTIQHAHNIALKNGTLADDVFSLLKNLGPYREKVNFYIMAYLNSIMNAPCGMENFIKKSKKYGVEGFIIPDLPFSEIKRKKVKIDFPLILFATNESPFDTLKEYKKYKPPFVYYIARYGTTGERKTLPDDIRENIALIKGAIELPLYIGFGISKKEHVKTLYEVADGVIVGSHLIKLIIENEDKRPENIGKIIKEEVKKLLG